MIISPRYQMDLVNKIRTKLWGEFKESKYRNVLAYIKKWHESDEYSYSNYDENFAIIIKDDGNIDLYETLHNINGETLLKIAIDLGIETPDFIPSIATFRNEIKSSYERASSTFEKAFKDIEDHPSIAIGLANSALESIIKQMLQDDRIQTKYNRQQTLHKLTITLLKELQRYPDNLMLPEIKTIGNSLVSICATIEDLRSSKTEVHGKANEEYVIDDPMYAYFVVNSVTTVGLFLKSFYEKKFPPVVEEQTDTINTDNLPF